MKTPKFDLINRAELKIGKCSGKGLGAFFLFLLCALFAAMSLS